MIYVTHDQTEALTFADKVVVMNDGRAVQIGTPAELFERPEHTFVGYFIGSPGMNLVPAEVHGGMARIAGQAIELGAQYPGVMGPATVGFRPDYTQLVRDGGIPVRIRRIEDLGRRRLARVALGAQDVFATVPQGQSFDGDRAGLLIDPARMFVYVDDRRVPGLSPGELSP
jgi:glycerol transport system ATP-binding protein